MVVYCAACNDFVDWPDGMTAGQALTDHHTRTHQVSPEPTRPISETHSQ